jgi:hypothetical protein
MYSNWTCFKVQSNFSCILLCREIFITCNTFHPEGLLRRILRQSRLSAPNSPLSSLQLYTRSPLNLRYHQGSTMNNRPVDQALATLLPTHAQDIPRELRSLALSFVAQSRSFSSSLKPDEEVARPFACAELACKRSSFTSRPYTQVHVLTGCPRVI